MQQAQGAPGRSLVLTMEEKKKPQNLNGDRKESICQVVITRFFKHAFYALYALGGIGCLEQNTRYNIQRSHTKTCESHSKAARRHCVTPQESAAALHMEWRVFLVRKISSA
jgi:hypothetical protein